MKTYGLSTGTVRVKRSFLFPSQGARRQLDLFLPGPWEGPVPIHCWAVEHEDRLLLIVDLDRLLSLDGSPRAAESAARPA